MNATPLKFRVAAAAAAIAITLSLVSAVSGLAEPRVAGALLAQAAAVPVR